MRGENPGYFKKGGGANRKFGVCLVFLLSNKKEKKGRVLVGTTENVERTGVPVVV